MTSAWDSINVGDNAPRRAPSLAEQAYEAPKGWIVNGELEPGTVLSENDLARRFAISRSPLREAIRRLQEEGLLDASGPRGFSVPPLTVDLVAQVYGVRLALETAAASTASPVPADELDAVAARLSEAEAAMDGGDLQPFTDSDFAFHDLFIARCGNPLLITHIARLRGSIQRILTFAGSLPEHSRCSLDEHRVILDALRTGDTDSLRAAVDTHIRGVEGRLIAGLRAADTAED